MTISRMQEPRQMYGIGGLLKKAARGIKKVIKSPLGKAAIIGGLGMYGGALGPFKGMKGAGFLKGLMGKVGASKLGGGIGNWWGGLSGGQKIFTGLAGAGIAAPFIQKALKLGPYEEGEEEEQPDWSITPSSIANIRNMARNQDPSLAFLPKSEYTNWYAADGGRAGLLNGGGAGEAQMEQMLRAEYIKYRNQGGTMPYEQFKILVMKQQSQQGEAPAQMMADGGRTGYRFGREVEQETDFIEGPQGNEEFSETLMASDPSWEDEWDQLYEMYKAKQIELGLEFVDKETFMMDYQDNMADGGRAGYANGDMVAQQTDLIEGPQGGEEFQETVVEGQEQPSREQLEALAMEIFQLPLEELDEQQLLVVYQEAMQGQPMEEAVEEDEVQFAAQGGLAGLL